MDDAELDAIDEFVWQLGTHWFQHDLYRPLANYGGLNLGEYQEWVVVQSLMEGAMRVARDG